MLLGYARVSTDEQHTDQQEHALKQAGCERIFVDHGVSGATKIRPELDRLLDQLRPRDVVVVTKLDRLGRDLGHMLQIVETIGEAAAGLRSLAESDIDTTSAAGKLVFRIFSVVAEFERDRLRERTKEGMSRAKANGVKIGRKPRLTDTAIEHLRSLRKQGTSYGSLAKTFKISASTARNYSRGISVKRGANE